MPLLGVFVVLVPGVLVAVRYATAESVGLALVLWALHWWRARPWLACVLLAAAGLTRETLLVVALALGVEVVHRRDWRRCWALVAALAPYAVWLLVVRVRFGAWRWQGETVRTTRPFARPRPSSARTSAAMLIIAITLGVAAVVVRPRDTLSHVAAAHILFVAALGRETLAQWPSVDRVLLPLWATAFIVCGATWSATMRPATPNRRDDPPTWPRRHAR